MENLRARIFVSGIVQGVFFRASARDMAENIGGVTGWVRNLPDGGVEVLAEGNRAKLGQLIQWLHRGPPGAVVESVEVIWEPATGEHSGFRVTR
jgi:acylphosphatase